MIKYFEILQNPKKPEKMRMRVRWEPTAARLLKISNASSLQA